jgi:hypothetical protein
LFWADDLLGTGGVIERADLETGERDLIVRELQSPVGVAIDTVAQQVYWTDQSTGMVQRANLDGSDAVDVLTQLNQPGALALSVVPEPSTRLLMLMAIAAWCYAVHVPIRHTGFRN